MNILLDYSIYDLRTGEILRMGMVKDEEHAQMQVQEHEGYVMRALDPAKHYMFARRVREYTPEEQARHAAKPHVSSTWNVSRKVWEDMRPPAMVRAEAVATLQGQIDALEAQQPRAIREHLLYNKRSKLMDIDIAIQPLRAKIAELKKE